MLLIDTDMLVLLAASGLLKRVVALLGYEMKDVRRLAAATHQVARSKSLRDQYGREVLETALPEIDVIAVAEPAMDLELLDRLNASMDPGEAVLVAVAASRADALLVTGDKRAIEDLIACADADCMKFMQGKMVSLEAVLWILLKEQGAHQLHSRLRIAPSHKTLRVIFSEENLASKDGCASAIRSYFANLDGNSAGLLYNPDPAGLRQ